MRSEEDIKARAEETGETLEELKARLNQKNLTSLQTCLIPQILMTIKLIS